MNDENNDRDNVNGYHNNNGKFAPGNPGKPKGSSKNKLRDEIKTFLNDNWVNFPTWFEALKAKEKIDVMLDLMPYTVSRLQSIAMTDSDGNDIPQPSVHVDDEEDVASGRVHVTGAWVLNNRRNVEIIFGTPNAIEASALSERTLQKIVYGGALNETDKQNIINAANGING